MRVFASQSVSRRRTLNMNFIVSKIWSLFCASDSAKQDESSLQYETLAKEVEELKARKVAFYDALVVAVGNLSKPVHRLDVKKQQGEIAIYTRVVPSKKLVLDRV